MAKPVPDLNYRLMIALDLPTGREAMAMAERLQPLGVSFKVGMQLFYAEGVAVVREVQALGGPVFVDLKLHDIPNTVGRAAESLVGRGAGFFNIHTQGGPEMMRAAVKGAQKAASACGAERPVVIGVTLLTSLSEALLREFLKVNPGVSAQDYVVHLAGEAKSAGLDGVVCSAREAAAIRQACGDDFILITPGIRPLWSAGDDQSRIVTPLDALKAGSDYLVVGRPVTAADNPRSVAERVLEEMHQLGEGSRV